MTLAKTAILSHRSPADLAGIIDPSIAAAFNVECADALFQSDLDREKRMYEATGLQVASNMITGGQPSQPGASGPIRLDA